MAKLRVHELAKELGLASKEMVEIIQGMGFDVKNHLSILEDAHVADIRGRLSKKKDDARVQRKKPESSSSTAVPVQDVSSGTGPAIAKPPAGTTPAESNTRETAHEQRSQTQRPPQKREDDGRNVAGASHSAESSPGSTVNQQGKEPNTASGQSTSEDGRPQQRGFDDRQARPGTDRGRQGQDNRPRPQDGQRPYSQDNRPRQQDGQRPYSQDNRPRPQDGQRPYSQDNRPRPQDGQRPYSQDNRPRPQDGQRPYSQDNRPRPQDGQRPYSQDNRPRPQDGQRPYSQDNRPRQQDGQRPYSPDNRPRPQGGPRPFGQDGRPRPQDGQRPSGPDNRPRPQGGQRPFQQDGRPRPQDGQRPFSQDNRPRQQDRLVIPQPAGDAQPKKVARPGKPAPAKEGERRDFKPKGKPVVAGKPPAGLEKLAPSEIAEIDPGNRVVPVKSAPRAQFPRPHTPPQRPGGDSQTRDYSRQIKKSKHKKKREGDKMVTPTMIAIGSYITVRDLAEELAKSPAEIVKKLMELGIMATINQEIDYDTVEILASLYEVEVQREVSQAEKMLDDIVDTDESLRPRPPIVTVMGHVDHGKTSLLDRIRQADVAAGEAGGITQHIGAYQVKINEQRITFIDTPGHEAFTAMRARGANVTDIAILVVAADDGVMPQTIEAISHIRAAQVPVIVAINKIDKPGANPDRIMQQLTEYHLVAEEWGGDTVFAQVSAKAGIGIEHLLEMILLVAEMHDIKANPERPAEGVVLEGKLDKGRGPVATVLIQKGTLRTGDTVISGTNWCKVRAMTDYKGRRVDEAFPSMPVEITGWSGVPEAGERVQYCDEKIAKQICEIRIGERKIEEQKQVSRVSLDDFFKKMKDAEVKDLNLIIKGDVQGSVEALTQSLLRLSTDEVKVNVIHSAAGAITESDVMLASASNAIIIGFNVRPDVKSLKYADDENIDVRLYRVIYEAIQDVRKAMEGLLEPEYREKYLGRVEVRATFKVPNVGIIAGAYVIDGKMQRSAQVRILRDGVIIYEGRISSLKRFKDDVKEVAQNYECGIGVQDFNDIKEGDIIEAYEMEAIARELS